MHLLPCGRHALLAEVAGAAEARSLATWARTRGLAVTEIVPAARTVLFDGIDSVEGLAALRAVLDGWSPDAQPVAGDLVEIAVVYDGPDLGFVAERWGTDEAGVVAAHTAAEYVASFCGFTPGFSYLDGLPEDRAVPRLDSPRASVPAGSVGLAGTWCGVYPRSSPGGWRILGRTDAPLWDADRDPPALLPPGTRVRFVAR